MRVHSPVRHSVWPQNTPVLQQSGNWLPLQYHTTVVNPKAEQDGHVQTRCQHLFWVYKQLALMLAYLTLRRYSSESPLSLQWGNRPDKVPACYSPQEVTQWDRSQPVTLQWTQFEDKGGHYPNSKGNRGPHDQDHGPLGVFFIPIVL